MKNPKITFIPASKEVEEFVDSPEPIKYSVPKWYKDASVDYLKRPIFNDRGRLTNVSIKQCMPFFDAMTAGYVQKTWCDIYIERTSENGINIISSTQPEIIGSRDVKNIRYYDDEFYPNEFFWKVPWQPKTSKNFSVLVTHPLNREDLPFTTMNGIIDSDLYFHGPFGNMPFYIKKGFYGLIPKGTPMFQYFPFERLRWSSHVEKYSEEVERLSRIQVSKFWGFYKNYFWKKKHYS